MIDLLFMTHNMLLFKPKMLITASFSGHIICECLASESIRVVCPLTEGPTMRSIVNGIMTEWRQLEMKRNGIFRDHTGLFTDLRQLIALLL